MNTRTRTCYVGAHTCVIYYIYMIQIIYKRVSPSLQLLNFKIGYDIKIAIN